MTAADIAVESERLVDPRTIAVWRWAALLAFTPFVASVPIVVIGTLAASPTSIPAWMALPAAVVAAAAAAWAWWYPGARYRHLTYRVDESGITIRHGIFWRTQSALPRVRIQHTDVSQGPLQRRYGIATLKLYTAGSRFTRTELPGLEYSAAVALRDELQRQGLEDAV